MPQNRHPILKTFSVVGKAAPLVALLLFAAVNFAFAEENNGAVTENRLTLTLLAASAARGSRK